MLSIRNSSLGSGHFWGINEQLTFTTPRQDSSSLLENPRKAPGSLDHDCLIIIVPSWEGISGVANIQWSLSTFVRHRGARTSKLPCNEQGRGFGYWNGNRDGALISGPEGVRKSSWRIQAEDTAGSGLCWALPALAEDPSSVPSIHVQWLTAI